MVLAGEPPTGWWFGRRPLSPFVHLTRPHSRRAAYHADFSGSRRRNLNRGDGLSCSQFATAIALQFACRAKFRNISSWDHVQHAILQ
jgi:hypothetical protein